MSRPKYPPVINVKGIGLADTYHKLIKACLNEGAEKKRFYGKPLKTYDIVSIAEITYPLIEPMLHPQFPTRELHLAEYEKQWERDYDWKTQGFEYNYMDRLIRYPTANTQYRPNDTYYNKSGELEFIDQLKVIRNNIAKRIEKEGECLVSNRDQVITWIPDRDMFVSEDQPCMQRIQFFVYEYPREVTFYKGDIADYFIEKELDRIGYKNGKVDFHIEWRSRDLFTAWNSNIIGLIKMLIKEIFEPNNLELVRVIDHCNSLHIYEGDWEAASKVKPVAINPMLMR